MRALLRKHATTPLPSRLPSRQVRTFTNQLDESNPILTLISDAMTNEAVLREKAEVAKTEAERKELEKQADAEELKRDREIVNFHHQKIVMATVHR